MRGGPSLEPLDRPGVLRAAGLRVADRREPTVRAATVDEDPAVQAVLLAVVVHREVVHQGALLDAGVVHQEVGHQAQELAEPAVEAQAPAGLRAARQENDLVYRDQADLGVGAALQADAGRRNREEKFG